MTKILSIVFMLMITASISAQIEIHPQAIEIRDSTTIAAMSNGLSPNLTIKNTAYATVPVGLGFLRFNGNIDLITNGRISFQSNEHVFKNIVGENTFFLSSSGRAQLPFYSLSDPQSTGLRTLYIDPDGNIETSTGAGESLDIHYGDFIPGDNGDNLGEVIIAVDKNNGFVHVSGNISDDGSFLAPVKLPNNVTVFSIDFSYINDSNDTFSFRFLEEEKKTTTSVLGSAEIVASGNLPKGGFFRSGSFLTTSIASHSIGLSKIIENGDHIYTLKIECKDCSNQYVKSISIGYTR